MVASFLLLELPVFALLAALLTLAGYLLLRGRTGRLPFLRLLVVWATVCYALSLVFLTLLFYWPDITFRPEWYFLNLVPFVWVRETYAMGAAKMAEQLLLNIGMFVPCGLLLPMAFPRLRAFWKTALAALSITLAIETLQYFMGRSADVDDVIMNFAGGLLGYALFALCRRLFSQTRFWQRALGGGKHSEQSLSQLR